MWINVQDLDIYHATIIYRVTIKLAIKQPLLCDKLCLPPNRVNFLLDYDFHRIRVIRHVSLSTSVKYLYLRMRRIPSSHYLAFQPFWALIFSEKNPECWLRRAISVPSRIQQNKTNTDAFTTPQKCAARTSTERINLNFY